MIRYQERIKFAVVLNVGDLTDSNPQKIGGMYKTERERVRLEDEFKEHIQKLYPNAKISVEPIAPSWIRSSGEEIEILD